MDTCCEHRKVYNVLTTFFPYTLVSKTLGKAACVNPAAFQHHTKKPDPVAMNEDEEEDDISEEFVGADDGSDVEDVTPGGEDGGNVDEKPDSIASEEEEPDTDPVVIDGEKEEEPDQRLGPLIQKKKQLPRRKREKTARQTRRQLARLKQVRKSKTWKIKTR